MSVTSTSRSASDNDPLTGKKCRRANGECNALTAAAGDRSRKKGGVLERRQKQARSQRCGRRMQPQSRRTICRHTPRPEASSKCIGPDSSKSSARPSRERNVDDRCSLPSANGGHSQRTGVTGTLLCGRQWVLALVANRTARPVEAALLPTPTLRLIFGCSLRSSSTLVSLVDSFLWRCEY